MVDAVTREAELEEVTDALLLTSSDDFNALAAEELRVELGHDHVQRLAPDPEAPFLVSPAHEDGLLLSYAEMSDHFADGARARRRDLTGRDYQALSSSTWTGLGSLCGRARALLDQTRRRRPSSTAATADT